MHRLNRLIPFIALLLLAACQSGDVNPPAATATFAGLPTLPPTPDDPGVVAPDATPDLDNAPLLAAYLGRVQTALTQPVPILPLDSGLDAAQQAAQTIAVQDKRFQSYSRDPQTGAPFRSEIFGVYPIRDSDLTQDTAACAQHACYRVEMYNYTLNFYLAATVDLDTQAVITVVGYQNTQPDIPEHLTAVAIEIATHAPEVIEALGYQPESSAALMANTKTALNNTLCDRSRHLCVAPTFVIGKQALWAIVDLTDGVLVGARWTLVGSTTPITEAELENESIMRRYCQHNTALEHGDWRMDYMLTSSDGLRIADVTFKGQTVIDNAKLVDWHVNYSSGEGFGYSDAVGCPMFSQAAVIAVKPPTVEDIVADGQKIGFALVQEFWSELWPQPCNYRYQQRYEFYDDGRFRPVVISLGRGCGNDGTYRPVTRVALAGNYTFAEWDGAAWKNWPVEGWRLASDVKPDAQDHTFRLSDSAGKGFYVIPSTGQFGDGGRGDDAYVYITLHHPNLDEGDSDMPTIGPCCNADYQQGPEKFINPEPEAIGESQLILWYVAQLKNDDTPGSAYCWAESVLKDGLYTPVASPCPSGPLFLPILSGAEGGAS